MEKVVTETDSSKLTIRTEGEKIEIAISSVNNGFYGDSKESLVLSRRQLIKVIDQLTTELIKINTYGSRISSKIKRSCTRNDETVL